MAEQGEYTNSSIYVLTGYTDLDEHLTYALRFGLETLHQQKDSGASGLGFEVDTSGMAVHTAIHYNEEQDTYWLGLRIPFIKQEGTGGGPGNPGDPGETE